MQISELLLAAAAAGSVLVSAALCQRDAHDGRILPHSFSSNSVRNLFSDATADPSVS